MDTASKATMEDEFGTSKDDDVVQQIIEKGTIIESEVRSFPYSLVHSVGNANELCRTLVVTAARMSRKAE